MKVSLLIFYEKRQSLSGNIWTLSQSLFIAGMLSRESLDPPHDKEWLL